MKKKENVDPLLKGVSDFVIVHTVRAEIICIFVFIFPKKSASPRTKEALNAEDKYQQ